LDKKFAYLFIISAAILWGIIGVFVTYLYELGFTPTQVVTVRAVSAAFFLVLYITAKNRRMPRIQFSDIKYFIGTGIVSFVFFNWCLFQSIRETSISIATILLYTAPAFVTIFSRIFFKETLTGRKLLALLITLIGCSFVIGILPSSTGSISIYGFILGLGSGLFYALYSIFGKFALEKYDSITVTLYTFIFAAIAVTPFSGIWLVLPMLSTKEAWFNIIGLGFFSTLLAFIFYTKGLSTVESSRASIIATIEPVVAALLSFILFNEKLGFFQYIGIIMVIVAVIIVQEVRKKSSEVKIASPSL
jgi:drug/metabolite transporter (DMT)-like permease